MVGPGLGSAWAMTRAERRGVDSVRRLSCLRNARDGGIASEGAGVRRGFLCSYFPRISKTYTCL